MLYFISHCAFFRIVFFTGYTASSTYAAYDANFFDGTASPAKLWFAGIQKQIRMPDMYGGSAAALDLSGKLA